MSNHPTIAALRASLESERNDLTANYFNEQLENGELNSRHMDSLDVAYKSGHEAATERLIPILEQAIATLEKIADVTSAIDYSIRNESYRDFELRIIAKEFLATLADTSGEMKKELK